MELNEAIFGNISRQLFSSTFLHIKDERIFHIKDERIFLDAIIQGSLFAALPFWNGHINRSNVAYSDLE